LFIPDMRSGNPYQQLYSDALESAGVNVSFGVRRRFFSITRSIGSGPKPDVVHIHWTHVFFCYGSPFVAFVRALLFLVDVAVTRARGVDIVWTVHNRWNHEGRYVWLDVLNSRVLGRIADSVIAACPAAAGEVRELFRLSERKVSVIPIGAYDGVSSASPGRNESRAALCLDSDATVFLFFGFVRPYKGILRLISEFESIEDGGARLCIVGRALDEDFRRVIEEAARTDPRIVTRLQYVSDLELEQWLAASDAVVVPFEDVLATSSVLRAMAAERAVIAPRLGCVPSVLDDHGGMLYDPKEEGALGKAIRLALGADLEAMGKHNAVRAGSEFSWERIAGETSALYARLRDDSPRPPFTPLDPRSDAQRNQ
jgi:beta-1,4-mannosyltransferase